MIAVMLGLTGAIRRTMQYCLSTATVESLCKVPCGPKLLIFLSYTHVMGLGHLNCLGHLNTLWLTRYGVNSV